jgi:hypothetical protein
MSEPAFVPPAGYSRIKVVGSFEELVSAPFGDGVNALCWPRLLPGDFAEIANLLTVSDEITTLDESRLNSLSLSEAGRVARDILIQDQQLLRSHDLSPVLDCVRSGQRQPHEGPLATDVYSFHADSATAIADTYLCSYNEVATEGLRNDEARRHVDIPETRAELLRLFGGKDDEEFLAYLNEHFYDLHYTALPDARPFSFGLGNLWRVAIEYPGSPVPPCIHRAPATRPGQPSRLLLLS